MRRGFHLISISLFIVTALFIASSCQKQPTVPDDEVNGCCGEFQLTVRDSAEHPVADLYVALLQSGDTLRIGRTAASGTVSFDSLCPGDYAFLVAGAPGFRPVAAYGHFTIDSCGKVQKHLTLSPHHGDGYSKRDSSDCCQSMLIVEVRDTAEPGTPIHGAAVVLKSANGQPLDTKLTDVEGRVVFTPLCSGTYIVVVEADGYHRYENSVHIGCDDTTEHSVELAAVVECCDNRVWVQVQDREHQVVEGAWVELLDLTHRPVRVIRSGYTNADGVIVWEDLCTGHYRVRATYAIAGEHGDSLLIVAKEDFEVECEDNKEIVLTLEPLRECCNHLLHVVLQDNRTSPPSPIADAEVRLRYPNGETIETAHTNDDGEAWFDGICRGTYEVRIAHPDYPVQEIVIEFPCKRQQLDLVVVFTGSTAQVRISTE